MHLTTKRSLLFALACSAPLVLAHGNERGSAQLSLGGKSVAILREPTRWPMLWDQPDGYSNNANDPPSEVVPHSGGLNVAYGDGHAKYYRMGSTGPEAEYWFEHSGDGLYEGQ